METRSWFLHESSLTRHAVLASVLATLGTAGYLVWAYPALPSLLPVHFAWNGRSNGWQFRTLPRVLLPVFVQLGLLGVGGAVAALLLSREDASTADHLPDARAAVAASEAVMLLCTVWVVFQAYAAYALIALWSSPRSTMGVGYTACELLGVVASVFVAVRAQRLVGKPDPLPYVAAHWRLGQLYCNPSQPALFVPTRRGGQWTLNFGRPAAVVLLGGLLGTGIIAPTVVLAIGLRY
jgi:uncharacterized membrane protein